MASNYYYERNKERIIKRNNEYRKRNPEIYRKSMLKYRYGITPEEKKKLGDSCQICNTTKDLCIDHDHETNEVRGLLCRTCNLGLGYFNDDPEILIKALKYLGL